MKTDFIKVTEIDPEVGCDPNVYVNRNSISYVLLVRGHTWIAINGTGFSVKESIEHVLGDLYND